MRAGEPAVAKLRDMSFFEYLNTVASSPTAGAKQLLQLVQRFGTQEGGTSGWRAERSEHCAENGHSRSSTRRGVIRRMADAIPAVRLCEIEA